jgi:DnaJ-class molecular chaperone
MTCDTCKGAGYDVDVQEGIDGDPPTVTKYACPDCDGTGERYE